MTKTPLLCAITITYLTFPLFAQKTAQPPPAPAPFRAALLISDRHGAEFDGALKPLNWNVDRIKKSSDELSSLPDNLTNYDMVLWTALFSHDFSKDAAKFREFVQNGGAIVIPDGNYESATSWLTELDPSLILPREGFASMYLPRLKETATPHPLRHIPYDLRESGSLWSHYNLPATHGWEVVARCARHDQPCFLLKRIGKGIVIVTNLRYHRSDFLENTRCLLELQREGIKATAFTGGSITLGRGELTLTLADLNGNHLNAAAQLEIQSLDDAKLIRRYVGQAAIPALGEGTIKIPYLADIRGPARVTLALRLGNGGIRTLINRTIDFPQILTITPPTYRSSVSTARRTADVLIDADLALIDEKLNSLRLKLTLADEKGKSLYNRTLSPLQLKQAISLPIPAKTPSGAYTLQATLSSHLKTYLTTTNTITIQPVRDGQVFIDQDGTFLSDGKPWFPLGLYHIPPKDLQNAVDLGLNTIQFWSWDAGALPNVQQAGLKVLWEQNHISGELAQRVGKERGNDKAIAMWYVLDEPGDESMPKGHEINNGWHAGDPDHPTYMVCNQFANIELQQAIADVFAIDPYVLGRNKPDGDILPMVDSFDLAQTALPRGKPIICVLQSFGFEAHPQFRAMAYLALAHDARGLFWYCWSQMGGGELGIGIKNNPELQQELKKLTGEIAKLTPALTSQNRRMFTAVDGAIHTILCKHDDANAAYTLILVNPMPRATKGTLELPELKPMMPVKDALTDAPVKTERGQLMLELAPYETRAYRW